MASSTGHDADKGSLRAHCLAFRARLSRSVREAADEGIAGSLERLPEFAGASLVLAYVSYGSEVDTRGVISRLLSEGRRVAVPRCDAASRSMAFYEIGGMADLAPGFHGILEPVPSIMDALGTSQMVGSACLVPGLAFDMLGHRLGYGGGYYDRFLAFYPGHKVGLCRGCQLSCAELPCDEHDVAVDFVVTEAGIMRTGLA